MSSSPASAATSTFTYCCNYDCCEKLSGGDDLFYDDGMVYCNEDCAFGHYYDCKREAKRAYKATLAATGSASKAAANAERAVSESVAANQQCKVALALEK